MRVLTLTITLLLVAGCGESGTTSGLLEEYVLSDPELAPESGDFDETNQAFYVGSIAKGIITKVDADGTETVIYTPPTGEGWRTLGVEINSAARLLWACANSTDDEDLYELWVINLELNARTAVLDLPLSVDSPQCNDIALDSSGLAYVTDSSHPNIYRADLDLDEVTVWSTSPVFPTSPSGGLNGIAVTADDKYILASRTLPPDLYRVVVAEPSSVAVIDIEPQGDNMDGITLLDGVLYVSFGGSAAPTGSVKRFTTSDEWASATLDSTDAPKGTSTVVTAEGRVYAIYSDIVNVLTGRPLNPPFRIFRVDNAPYE